jgi:RimJ/RimL family protein N-acetyltransferase
VSRSIEPAYPLRTDRLELRPFALDDVAAMHAIHSREDVARWFDWPPQSEEDVRAMIDERLSRTSIAAPGDKLDLAIVCAETGRLIGDCLLAWRPGAAQHRQGEIGYSLHPDHQGYGYATEAARELLRLAFEELELHRVVGLLEARNAPSARVLERLGMRREAHLVENGWVKGEWQSELVYALLDREWREASR